MLGLCGGLERTDFDHFPLWVGGVVLNELILTVSILAGCGHLDRTVFNSLYVGKVWWS